MTEALGHLVAVDAGHHHVEQNEIRLGPHGLLQGVLALMGNAYVVALEAQDDLDRPADVPVVVDDEDPLRQRRL